MTYSRCAVCKYFRRRCRSDCIFAPYFPTNNPQRFACVHRIYGASNIGRMLEELPMDLRADAVKSVYFEAKCRIQDPVYGCVGIISSLHQEISNAQSDLAKAQAEIALVKANVSRLEAMPREIGHLLSFNEPMAGQDYVDHGLDYPLTPWFY